MFFSVQFARIFAATIVFVGHWAYTSNLDIKLNGSIGVDIFFVVSGFVISASIQKYDDPIVFLSRRALRIFPTYLIAAIPVVLWNIQEISPLELLKNLLLIPVTSSGSIDFQLVPAWTLSYELAFYAFATLVFFFMKSIASRVFLVVLIALIIYLSSHPLVFVNNLSLEFAFGVFLYKLERYSILQRVSLFASGAAALWLVGTLGILGLNDAIVENIAARTVVWYDIETIYPRALTWGLTSFFFVSLLLMFEKIFYKFSNVIKFLADHSYEFYLMQFYWFFASGMLQLSPVLSLIVGLTTSFLMAIVLRHCSAKITRLIQ